jgi:hypothetical protein
MSRRHHVEAIGRLVEQHVLRVVNERARERDFRTLALRVALCLAVGDRAELESRDQLVGALRDSRLDKPCKRP